MTAVFESVDDVVSDGTPPFDADAFGDLLRQYPDDLDIGLDVADALRALRIRNAAREYEASAAWTAPSSWPGTAAEQLTEQIPQIDWVVDDLLPSGIWQLNAQQKSGKTTLALNLVRSLLTGNAFLRRFETRFGSEETIGYFNLELDKAMFLRWVSDLGMAEAEHKRLHLYHARESGFGRPDLKNSRQMQWLIEWLVGNNVTVLFIDTLSKLYDPQYWGGGTDPNIPYNRFWQSMESLKREAGLRGVLILHHTGYSEEGAQRARGASAMMDNPDVNLTYRHNGSQGGAAPDSKRYLSANGRIDQIAEFELDYDPGPRALHATGSGMSRDDAGRRRRAAAVWEYLDAQKTIGIPEVAKTKLLNALQLPANGNGLTRLADPTLDYAVELGWVQVRKAGNSKQYSVGSAAPPTEERTTSRQARNGPSRD